MNGKTLLIFTFLSLLFSPFASASSVEIPRQGTSPASALLSEQLELAQETQFTPIPAYRMTDENYWVGGLIGPEHVPSIVALGIKLVISAVVPSDETLELLRQAEIEQVSLPLGSRFQHSEQILELVDRYRPEEVFIHCRHGADRAGAIIAFLLIVRHQWEIADALYSVVYPTRQHTEGINTVLAEFDIWDPREPGDPSVGVNAIPIDRGGGGLKAHNDAYRIMIRTLIETLDNYPVTTE